jgi:protein TonB
MVQAINERNRDRLKASAGVVAFHLLLGYALIVGLGFDPMGRVAEQLKMFDVLDTPPPPPPPATPAPPDTDAATIAKPKQAEGAASPANLRDTPTQIVAPKPIIPLPVPPPIAAAPAAGQGNAEAAGAADVPGPGTGSGGVGTGLGSGLNGDGTGGGGGGGIGRGSPVRWLRGRIYDSDYPRRAYEARFEGTVYLRFVVAPDGYVSDCAVTRSSGNREVDETTCRLIMRRFRYRPARNEDGRPIASTIRGEHHWELAPEPEPIDVEPDIPEED